MTRDAVLLDVSPGEFIAGQLVIKFVGIKPDDVERAAMVVAVAGKTILPFYFC